MPVPQKADTMTARIKRMEQWQSKHEKECLKVYTRIEASTSVLPAMKKQLDSQDELLSALRDVRATIRVTRPLTIALGGIVAAAVGAVQILQYLAEHIR